MIAVVSITAIVSREPTESHTTGHPRVTQGRVWLFTVAPGTVLHSSGGVKYEGQGQPQHGSEGYCPTLFFRLCHLPTAFQVVETEAELVKLTMIEQAL